jgi:hypothetical protein
MNDEHQAIPQEEGRGVLILILGIVSLVSFGPILGIPAWIMGRNDLRKIDQGRIPQSERSNTKTGMVLGIIGTLLFTFIIILGIAVAVFISLFSQM